LRSSAALRGAEGLAANERAEGERARCFGALEPVLFGWAAASWLLAAVPNQRAGRLGREHIGAAKTPR